MSELEDAPTHVKLAIDLIMLLEQHDIAPEEVLKALEIVKSDFSQKKQQADSLLK
ncbi:MAG: YbaM family protein [Pseudoalteromonas sp.]|uniref:YbaM family protein n=1 Tax=unclassified Pseudoalteromonas TaxID=194690 RepID=UPI003F99D45B